MICTKTFALSARPCSSSVERLSCKTGRNTARSQANNRHRVQFSAGALTAVRAPPFCLQAKSRQHFVLSISAGALTAVRAPPFCLQAKSRQHFVLSISAGALALARAPLLTCGSKTRQLRWRSAGAAYFTCKPARLLRCGAKTRQLRWRSAGAWVIKLGLPLLRRRSAALERLNRSVGKTENGRIYGQDVDGRAEKDVWQAPACGVC